MIKSTASNEAIAYFTLGATMADAQINECLSTELRSRAINLSRVLREEDIRISLNAIPVLKALVTLPGWPENRGIETSGEAVECVGVTWAGAEAVRISLPSAGGIITAISQALGHTDMWHLSAMCRSNMEASRPASTDLEIVRQALADLLEKSDDECLEKIFRASGTASPTGRGIFHATAGRVLERVAPGFDSRQASSGQQVQYGPSILTTPDLDEDRQHQAARQVAPEDETEVKTLSSTADVESDSSGATSEDDSKSRGYVLMPVVTDDTVSQAFNQNLPRFLLKKELHPIVVEDESTKQLALRILAKVNLKVQSKYSLKMHAATNRNDLPEMNRYRQRIEKINALAAVTKIVVIDSKLSAELQEKNKKIYIVGHGALGCDELIGDFGPANIRISVAALAHKLVTMKLAQDGGDLRLTACYSAGPDFRDHNEAIAEKEISSDGSMASASHDTSISQSLANELYRLGIQGMKVTGYYGAGLRGTARTFGERQGRISHERNVNPGPSDYAMEFVRRSSAKRVISSPGLAPNEAQNDLPPTAEPT